MDSMNRMGDVPRKPWIKVETSKDKPTALEIVIGLVLLAAVLLGTIKLTEWEVRQDEVAKAKDRVSIAYAQGYDAAVGDMVAHREITTADGEKVRSVWTKIEEGH